MRNRSLSVLGLVLLNTLLCCGQTPDAVLTIEPNWPTFYRGEFVTFICDMNEGEETDWSYQINMNGQDVIPYNFYKSYILEHLYQSGEYHCCGLRRSSNKPKCSKTLSVTVSAYRPRATLTAGSTTIPVGGSVTLSCSVETSAGWKYRWFRRTSDISEVRIDNEENRDISVTQGGIYRCDGVRGNPDFYTVISNEETIETKFSNKVFVTQQPNLPQIFSGETITLTCEVQGGETTEWTYEWKRSETVLHRINSKDWTFIVSESSSGDYMCQCRRRDDWYSSTQWSKSITLSVSVTESSPVNYSFLVLLIVGPVIGVILFILLLLLWRHRQFKDLCCIRLFQSESSSQSSTTNHGVNQAESHVYSSLLHGNSCLYETIQTRGATGNERSHHPEEGSDYVNMKPDSSIG